MSIRVIIMDVDGTLINNKKEITPATKAALLLAQEKGITLVLASGRPTPGLLDFARELEMDKHHGLLVSYNGSKVVDSKTGEVLFSQAISIEQGQAVLEHMKKFNVRPMIDKDNYMFVNNVYDNDVTYGDNQTINIIRHEARLSNFLLCEVEDLACFATYPLYKILTAGDEAYLKANYQEMMAPFKDTLNCVFTDAYYFEYTAKGIDKANALDKVLVPMGYCKEEMIAFGDSQNDITMLQYAGIGIAMENATDEIKEIADEITLSNENDGIAASLYKHLPDIYQ